jgi:hypothetical protein
MERKLLVETAEIVSLKAAFSHHQLTCFWKLPVHEYHIINLGHLQVEIETYFCYHAHLYKVEN